VTRALVLLLLLSGCGVYRWGYTPAGGTTVVAAPIFKNKTLRRGLEYALAQHLRQRILDATPLQLAGEDSGAPVIQGTIVAVSQAPVIPNENDQAPPIQSTVSVTVSVALVSKAGNVLAGGPDGGPALLVETENWVPTFGQSAESAEDRCLKKLAERIVDLIEDEWGGPAARKD